MGAPAVGDVVLVRFPFSDLSGRSGLKLRPAVVLASAERDDVIVCQITSRPYASQRAVSIAGIDFADGGLGRDSFARPDKLFTAAESIVVRTVGALRTSKQDELRAAVVGLFGG